MKRDKFEKPVCHKETFNGGLGKIIDRILIGGCTFKVLADKMGISLALRKASHAENIHFLSVS